MYFSSIELYNFGIYRGQHIMHLQNQQGNRNITLVGGLNGRGKTTILDAVFICLYGRKSIEYVVGKRTAYNKLLSDRINKSAEDGHTYVKLMIELDDEENSGIAITRSWQKNGKGIASTLTVEKNGIEDTYLSKSWEYYVEELIPFGIARFFFFDNEKISQIADDEAFDKIKSSIKSVMGVTTIESLCQHIEKIRKEKEAGIRKSSSASLSAQVEELTSAMEACKTNMKRLYFKKASMIPELEKINVQLEQTEQAFWKEGGNLGFNREQILKDQKELKEKEEQLKGEALTLASSPATPLLLCRELCANAFNHVKSNGEAYAKQYSLPIIKKMYGDLLTDFKSNWPEDPDSYNVLLELVDAQIAALEMEANLNSANVITPLAQTLLERFLSHGVAEAKQKATFILSENERTLTSLNQLEVHLSSGAEKANTTALLNQIKELQAKKTQMETEITRCDDQIHSANYEKEQLEREKNKVFMKITSEADVSDDNARMVEYSTMTIEVMKEFVTRLQAQKVTELEKNITSCFEFLSQKQGIITSISIDPKSLDITLRDYKGGILLKEQLSAGEKQMFAISILWGLALSSGYKLPVIIDTPMARLDSVHRSNFINKYLPNASSQVIVLSTDEEINGEYLEAVQDHVSTTYTLEYNEAEKCSSIRPGYFGGDLNDL